MTVSYEKDGRVAIFDGRKFRRDLKTGYYLSSKKTDCGHQERLHRYVWRYFNGEIPEGFHIHHLDEDKSHNDIENLVCISGGSHSKYHLTKYAAENHDAVKKNLDERARPKANEWHRSDDGRKWHSKHGKEVAENMKPRRFECENCGKAFYKKPLGQVKFCSNACKSAARRASGVDDEERTCIICEKKFKVNKYAKTKTCSSRCRDIYAWRTSRVSR